MSCHGRRGGGATAGPCAMLPASNRREKAVDRGGPQRTGVEVMVGEEYWVVASVC